MSAGGASTTASSYEAIEALVASHGISGAVEALAGHEADEARWSGFLHAAAFAVDRQETAAGRRQTLRRLAFDDEDPAIAAEAGAHAAACGVPALHLIGSSIERRTCDATVVATHACDVRHLAVGGGLVISASHDGIVRTVDATTGEAISTVKTSEVRALVHLRGPLVAVGLSDGAVEVIDGREGVAPARFRSITAGVSSLARLDGDHVASGHLDGRVGVHRLGTGVSAVSTHHRTLVRAIVPAGPGLLAAAGYDGRISLGDLSGQAVGFLDHHAHPVRAMASDREILCSVDDGGLTCVWDLGSASLVASNQGPYRGVHRVLILDSGDLVVADFDGTLRVLDRNKCDEIVRRRSHTARVRTLVQLEDGHLLTASDDRTVRTWTASGLEEVTRRTGHLGWVRNAAELPDGRVVSSSIDKTVRVWPRRPAGSEPAGHLGWIRALVDCGGVVASAAEDGTVRLWNLDDGRCTDVSRATTGATRCLASGGGWVAAGDDHGALITWSLASSTLQDRRVVGQAHDNVRGVAVLTGDLLVSAGADGWLRAWRLSDLTCVAAVRDRQGGGWRTVLAVDATTVAAGNEHGDLVIWDVGSLRTHRLGGHGGRIWATTALGPDRILTISFDRTARLWDLDQGREITKVGDPLGASWGVAAVGQALVAAASPIGVVRVARSDDLSVVARADLRSATVSITSARRSDGRWSVIAGGDAPRPLFLQVRPESVELANDDSSSSG